MNFLQPWAAWFLAGLPIIVALYFLRLKRRVVQVSTDLFWQRVLAENRRRALFQRLRHWLSLLLHLLIFALLVAALARPLFHQALHQGTSTVLILDNRARMQALEADGQSRFSKALLYAQNLARQASPQQPFALLLLEAAPTVAVPFTGESKPLLDALEALQPTDTAGDADAATQLAQALLRSQEGSPRAIWITARGLQADSKAPLPSGFETVAVGTPRDNLAITRFSARPLPASPETSEVFLEVQNFGEHPARTDVELSFDGRLLDVKTLQLAAGEKQVQVFSSVPRPGRTARGWLTAQLTAVDALAEDNRAYALLPPLQGKRVLLVSRGNSILEKFLAVAPGVKFQLLTPEAWQPDLVAKFAVVIFDKTLPANFTWASAQGNLLFLASSPLPSAAPLERPLVTESDANHPALRNVAWQNLNLLRAQNISLPVAQDGWVFAAPLRSFEHPLLVTAERPSQRIAVLPFDLLESDLPLRIAFPLLMNNLLEWLVNDPHANLPSILAGEAFSMAVGEHAGAEPCTTPPPPARLSTPIVDSLQPLRNGYYPLATGDEIRWLAVNTFSPAESDLRGGATGPRPPENPLNSRFNFFPRWPVWQWLALAALLLFTAEWWLFHRRSTE